MVVDDLHYTFGLDTTFLVWKAIKDNLLSIMKEQEIYLIDNLIRLKKEDLLVDKNIKRFCSLCDNLAAISKPINDVDKCFHLSHGLGPKYQDF